MTCPVTNNVIKTTREKVLLASFPSLYIFWLKVDQISLVHSTALSLIKVWFINSVLRGINNVKLAASDLKLRLSVKRVKWPPVPDLRTDLLSRHRRLSCRLTLNGVLSNCRRGINGAIQI